MATKKERAAAIRRQLKKPSLTGLVYIGGVALPLGRALIGDWKDKVTQNKVQLLMIHYFGFDPFANGTFLNKLKPGEFAQTWILPAAPAAGKKIVNKIAGNVISNALKGMPVRS